MHTASHIPQGKTILVTAHTHAAVDNMLIAVKRLQVPVHRIGHSGSVHSDIEEHVINGPIVDVMLRMKGTAATTGSASNSAAVDSSSGGGGCVIGCTSLSVQVTGFSASSYQKL